MNGCIYMLGLLEMTKFRGQMVRVHVKWGLARQVSFLKRVFRYLIDRILACSCDRRSSYKRLEMSPSAFSGRFLPENGFQESVLKCMSGDSDGDSNLVVLKISLLGDCQIGKTSFMTKYVGDEEDKSCLQMTGLNLMDKIFFIQGARIAFSIWDVGGDRQFLDHVPVACKDAAAILIMFDLTSRSTLNSVIDWYRLARQWNQTAIPILIGTKFDDFVHLPPDIQWTIVNQARMYAHAMKATLFFSSALHNINVNKIFKFITAKLFDLPWSIERNLTIGEPIIDF